MTVSFPLYPLKRKNFFFILNILNFASQTSGFISLTFWGFFCYNLYCHLFPLHLFKYGIGSSRLAYRARQVQDLNWHSLFYSCMFWGVWLNVVNMIHFLPFLILVLLNLVVFNSEMKPLKIWNTYVTSLDLSLCVWVFCLFVLSRSKHVHFSSCYH